MQILQVNISDSLRELAKVQESTIPETIKNSILKGGGRYIGLLGELCVCEALQHSFNIRQDNTYGYDLTAVECNTNIFLEVKTKACAGIPLKSYECSVADANLTQGCDAYVFTRITKDFKTAYILGVIDTILFHKISRPMKKGQSAPNMKQGSIVQDCHNVYIHELTSFVTPDLILPESTKIIEIR